MFGNYNKFFAAMIGNLIGAGVAYLTVKGLPMEWASEEVVNGLALALATAITGGVVWKAPPNRPAPVAEPAQPFRGGF